MAIVYGIIITLLVVMCLVTGTVGVVLVLNGRQERDQ